MQRGIHKCLGRTVEQRQVRVLHKAESVDLRAARRTRNAPMDYIRSMPVASAEDQSPVALGVAFELLDSLDQPHVILARMFQARDVEKKRFLWTRPRSAE